MLVRFKSEVGGFVMFGDVAVQLLRMTGHSGTVPGAIAADEMAQALARLEARLLEHAQVEQETDDADSSGDAGADGEPPVALAQRAFAMLDLMRRAAVEPCDIQWLED